MEDKELKSGESVEIEERQETRTPARFRVFLLNDDYTTMDFVIYILETVFHKKSVEATQIMLHVHKNGKGLAGVYTREIADTKITAVHEMATQHGYPLKCNMEME